MRYRARRSTGCRIVDCARTHTSRLLPGQCAVHSAASNSFPNTLAVANPEAESNRYIEYGGEGIV